MDVLEEGSGGGGGGTFCCNDEINTNNKILHFSFNPYRYFGDGYRRSRRGFVMPRIFGKKREILQQGNKRPEVSHAILGGRDPYQQTCPLLGLLT